MPLIPPYLMGITCLEFGPVSDWPWLMCCWKCIYKIYALPTPEVLEYSTCRVESSLYDRAEVNNFTDGLQLFQNPFGSSCVSLLISWFIYLLSSRRLPQSETKQTMRVPVPVRVRVWVRWSIKSSIRPKANSCQLNGNDRKIGSSVLWAGINVRRLLIGAFKALDPMRMREREEWTQVPGLRFSLTSGNKLLGSWGRDGHRDSRCGRGGSQAEPFTFTSSSRDSHSLPGKSV